MEQLRPRTVGMVTSSFPRDDNDVAGRFVRGYANTLARTGLRIEVVAPHFSGAQSAESYSTSGGGEVRVFRVRYGPDALETVFYGGGVPDNLRRLATAPLMLGAAARCLSSFVRERSATWDARVTHWPVPLASLGGRPRWFDQLRRPVGMPHHGVFHSADVHLATRLPRRVLWTVLSELRSAQFVSAGHKRKLLQLLEGAPDFVTEVIRRALVLPMGFEALSGAQKAKLDEDASGPPIVLAVGRLVPVKGFVDLLEAYALVRAVMPVAPRLVIAGEGPERVRLANRARGLGLDVELPGVVVGDELAALFRRAKLLVSSSRRLPSGRSEGAPVVLLEALAHGVPIVATAVGGVPELAAGTGMRLVAASRPRSMAAGIEETLRAISGREPGNRSAPDRRVHPASRHSDWAAQESILREFVLPESLPAREREKWRKA